VTLTAHSSGRGSLPRRPTQQDRSWRQVSAATRGPLGAQAHEFVNGDSGEVASTQMSAYRDHSPTQPRKPPVEAGNPCLTRCRIDAGRDNRPIQQRRRPLRRASGCQTRFYRFTCRSSASRQSRTSTLTVGRGGERPTPQDSTAPPRLLDRDRMSCADTSRTSGDNPTSTADSLLIGDNRTDVVPERSKGRRGRPQMQTGNAAVR